MTAKHFKALAEQLKDSKPGETDTAMRGQWENDLIAVALACRQVNTGFDARRFFLACEPEQWEMDRLMYSFFHPYSEHQKRLKAKQKGE